MTCIFCEIISGNASASLVYRDATCIAFMDIHPANPGHLLVVPNQHAASLAELPPKTGGWMLQVGQRLARALRLSGLRCEGINLLLADGEIAGQEVFHAHLHLIPRFAGDGLVLDFAPASHLLPTRETLEENARNIREALSPASQ